MTCKKAQGFLGKKSVTVTETVDAGKKRFGEAEVLALLDGIDMLIVTRGQKVETTFLKDGRPDDAELIELMTGPTGNLRAPTARVGRTLIVGFNPEVYAFVLRL